METLKNEKMKFKEEPKLFKNNVVETCLVQLEMNITPQKTQNEDQLSEKDIEEV